jgi:hypothetical protein
MLVRVVDELSEEFSQVGEDPYVKCTPPWRDGTFRELDVDPKEGHHLPLAMWRLLSHSHIYLRQVNS